MDDLERLRRQMERVLRQVRAITEPARTLQESLRVINRLTLPQIRLPELDLASKVAQAVSPHTLVAAQQQIMASQEAVRLLTGNFAAFQERIASALEPLSQSMRESAAFLLQQQLQPVMRGVRLVLENEALFQKVRLPEYRRVSRAINQATRSLQVSTRIALRVDAEVARAPFSLVATVGVIGAGAAEVGRAEDIRPALDPWKTGPGQLREALYEYLEELHSDLARKARGAWDALERGDPDATSQAAHSMQELLDHVLRKEAPEEVALPWCQANYSKGVEKGNLTRAGRVHYICAQRGRDPEPAESLARTVSVVSGFAQGAKHSLDFPDGDRIPAILLVVEGLLGYLLL